MSTLSASFSSTSSSSSLLVVVVVAVVVVAVVVAGSVVVVVVATAVVVVVVGVVVFAVFTNSKKDGSQCFAFGTTVLSCACLCLEKVAASLKSNPGPIIPKQLRTSSQSNCGHYFGGPQVQAKIVQFQGSQVWFQVQGFSSDQG